MVSNQIHSVMQVKDGTRPWTIRGILRITVSMKDGMCPHVATPPGVQTISVQLVN
jgi:hypothetical protein